MKTTAPLPITDPWAPLIRSLEMFTDDCLADGIEDLLLQDRPALNAMGFDAYDSERPAESTAEIRV